MAGHGATPGLPETPTGKFMRDDGSWQDPPGGGTPPTGTGWRHVTNGAEDPERLKAAIAYLAHPPAMFLDSNPA
jgi:hypothetical protein